MAIGLGLLALQAFSSFAGFSASKKDEKINKNINNFNARLAARNAELALRAGQERAGNIREETDSLVSRHRTAFASSNLVTTEGSPLLAQLEQRAEGEKAAQGAILESKFQAQGFSAQESLTMFDNKVNKVRGKSERESGLLSGAANSVDIYRRFR